MKRGLMAGVLLLSLVFAVSAWAAESTVPKKDPAAKFEQKKARILKRFEVREAKLQQQKACVEAAKNDDDLKACKEKYGPHRRSSTDKQGSTGVSGGQQGVPGGTGTSGAQAPPPAQ